MKNYLINVSGQWNNFQAPDTDMFFSARNQSVNVVSFSTRIFTFEGMIYEGWYNIIS